MLKKEEFKIVTVALFPWPPLSFQWPSNTTEITYMTGHQSSCIPTDQDDGLVWKMAVDLCDKRKTTVNRRLCMGTDNPTLLGAPPWTKLGHSHLQHFASHCPNHVFKALQNSYPTTIVQQMGSYRDDLKGKKEHPCSSAKFQTSIPLNLLSQIS